MYAQAASRCGGAELTPSISLSCLCDVLALALDASNDARSVEFFITIATMLRADIAIDNVHTTGSRAQDKTIALMKSATESCSATETCNTAPAVGMAKLAGISASAGRAETGYKYGSNTIRQGSRTKQHALSSRFSCVKDAGVFSDTRNNTTGTTGYISLAK